jgi:vacuolar-type H+-ATPase subunit H
MIEKTIEELKNAEKEVDSLIEQAGEEAHKKIKDFEIECENEWVVLNNKVDSLKKEIFEKFENEAEKELEGIKEEADKRSATLQHLSSGKDSIVALVIEDLLKA